MLCSIYVISSKSEVRVCLKIIPQLLLWRSVSPLAVRTCSSPSGNSDWKQFSNKSPDYTTLYAPWLKSKAILSRRSLLTFRGRAFLTHKSLSMLSSFVLSLTLSTASPNTLFIIHVYHHTMSTICYQFHGWTGSNLELLHETRLYRQHWNRSHLV